jgi:hypothetical protein
MICSMPPDGTKIKRRPWAHPFVAILCYAATYSEAYTGHTNYPQTFHWIVGGPKSKFWERHTAHFLRLLCDILIGHELSRTEHGYSGGVSEDAWCRWCNKIFSVPLGTFYDKVPEIIESLNAKLDLEHVDWP